MVPAMHRDQAGADQPLSIMVLVQGRVQGVGFRDFTRREAQKLDVGGWVRNEPDGTVRALLQHPRMETLEQLVARLRSGPPASRVTAVETVALKNAKPCDGFEIHR
jgi:acylphosphatase